MASDVTSHQDDVGHHGGIGTEELQNEEKYQGIATFIGGVEMALGSIELLIGIVGAIVIVLNDTSDGIVFSGAIAALGLVLLASGALKKWKNKTKCMFGINMCLSIVTVLLTGVFFGIVTWTIATNEKGPETFPLALAVVSFIVMLIEISHAGYFAKATMAFRKTTQPMFYYDPTMRDMYFGTQSGSIDKTYFASTIPTGFTFVAEKQERISTVARRFSRFVPEKGASVHFSDKSAPRRPPLVNIINTRSVSNKAFEADEIERYSSELDSDLPDPPSEILRDIDRPEDYYNTADVEINLEVPQDLPDPPSLQDEECSLPEADTVIPPMRPVQLHLAITDAIKSLAMKQANSTDKDTPPPSPTESSEQNPSNFSYNGDRFEIVLHEVTDLTFDDAKSLTRIGSHSKLAYIRNEEHFLLVLERVRAMIPSSRSFTTIWLGLEIDKKTREVKLPDGQPAPYLVWFPTCPLKKEEYTKVGLYVSKSAKSSYQGMFNSPPTDIKHGVLLES